LLTVPNWRLPAWAKSPIAERSQAPLACDPGLRHRPAQLQTILLLLATGPGRGEGIGLNETISNGAGELIVPSRAPRHELMSTAVLATAGRALLATQRTRWMAAVPPGVLFIRLQGPFRGFTSSETVLEQRESSSWLAPASTRRRRCSSASVHTLATNLLRRGGSFQVASSCGNRQSRPTAR